MKTPKRPRDPAQLANLMVDIATGEVEDAERKGRPEKGAPELKSENPKSPKGASEGTS